MAWNEERGTWNVVVSTNKKRAKALLTASKLGVTSDGRYETCIPTSPSKLVKKMSSSFGWGMQMKVKKDQKLDRRNTYTCDKCYFIYIHP